KTPHGSTFSQWSSTWQRLVGRLAQRHNDPNAARRSRVAFDCGEGDRFFSTRVPLPKWQKISRHHRTLLLALETMSAQRCALTLPNVPEQPEKQSRSRPAVYTVYPTELIAAAKPPLHVWQTALVRSIRLRGAGWNGVRMARFHSRRRTR